MNTPYVTPTIEVLRLVTEQALLEFSAEGEKMSVKKEEEW